MKRRNIALVLNIAAFVCGCVGIIFRLSHSLSDFFLYYTQISNVVAVISSAMYIACRNTQNKRLRGAVTASRYLGACMLTMTFLVVVCIFVPFGTEVTTRRLLGSVNGILHHIVCPVVSVISYIFFEDGVKTKKAILIPFIATAIYALTVYALNFLRLANAPYPFFEVYDHPIWELVLWFFGLMGLVTGIAVMVRAANIGIRKKK
ncbi:MAG: hypothetical protein II820_01270 [Ruminiclostridium sp.]|nr:hypothetical protein [Ruminiclostridium sp.]